MHGVDARRRKWLAAPLLVLCILGLHASPAAAVNIAPAFAGSYTFQDLGSAPGVPTRYGGLTLKYDDPNLLIIGGVANEAPGALYAIRVVRDANNHITGFQGTATRFADAAYNDGGVVYGPGNVLFLSRWPVNQLGQTRPGSTTTDRIIDLAPLGIAQSHAALNFVPPTHPGAGALKLVSWSGGQWYTAGVTPDGSGTYNLVSVTAVPASTVPGGPEGFIYVPLGSPLFPGPTMLVSEYSANLVTAYNVNANGDPIIASRREFVQGLTGAEGAFIDPVTGDFLFSTFGGANQVIVVRGFAAPAVPEPGTLTIAGVAALGLLAYRWRRRQGSAPESP